VHRLKENSSKQNTNEIMIISISRRGSIMVHCISKKNDAQVLGCSNIYFSART
jgi:hypothetical protein